MEIQILNFIQNNMTSPVMDKLMVFFTNLGSIGIIWIIAGIIMLFFKKYRYFGFMLLATLLITAVTVEFGVKEIFDRPRPYTLDSSITLLIPPPSGSSFPSGHTATSFACAFIIYKINKKISIIAFIYASIVAFSRLYLYVHYPSDVLAGILIGLAMGEIVFILFTIIRRYRNNRALKGVQNE